MAQNPTHNPDTYSRELIQETIRPGIESYLDQEFDDPNADQRGDPIPDEPGTWPPLVVTALPNSGRVLYPHVVVAEQGDDSEPADPRLELSQHDFAVDVEVHGRTSTEMFNLRGLVRGWFLHNRGELRDAGLAEVTLSGNSGDWDATSRTATWQLTVTGLLHTHPDSDFTIN